MQEKLHIMLKQSISQFFSYFFTKLGLEKSKGNGKEHSWSYSQRGPSFGSQKLQALQFNLSGIQTNGTRQSRFYTTSMGRWGLVIRGTTWLQNGQHCFRTGYSFESQIITVCQEIPVSLVEAFRLDAIIIDFSKAFALVSHDRLLKNCSPWRGFDGGFMK